MDSTKLPNPQSMRVLIRPPSSSSAPPTQFQIPPPPPHPPPSTPPDQPPAPPTTTTTTTTSSPPQNGVVVVGFIGKRSGDVTYLINRIIDANAFGSGNLDKRFRVEKSSDEIKNLLGGFRNISYYHDEEKGILFLQSSSTRCPVMMEGNLESCMGFDSVMEDHEFCDLQAMLFIFSVCHVVIFIQEGSRFDTQILKKCRVLQVAKQAMAPYVKSRSQSPSGPGSSFASPSHRIASGRSSNNPSPVKSRGIFNRNASAITLMSGLGSYTSLLPGQCTPVTLFVFLDDIADNNPSSSVEDPADNSSTNQSSSSSTLARPSLPPKGSGSVVVLARPVSKSEGGFRKKLQSSLEQQIRFLIKRCRTLSGSETSHTGLRSGGVSNAAPLFSLDASKAVALVDITSNTGGESLEFATGLLEDVLNAKATSDSLLLESHGKSANREDILAVKEFICRQADILRGKGGLVSNTNSSPAAGVGMVAVAAAAAAASAASGKRFTSPELPSLEKWLSSSQLILQEILSAKHGCVETEISKRKPCQRNSVSPPVEGNTSKVSDPLEIAVSYLESGRGMNTRFSTLWCQKALPVAKETYLNELPRCYPTSQHKAHLERALHSFNSMVKGPAVQFYMQKLEDECTSIWSSGRQLCDAVSLTGKPCMHQRHDVETVGLCSSDEIKPHSSGYVFLHACACGRCRRLRSDPFDFETANSTFIMDCDKLLPTLQLPQENDTGPIQPSAWSLIRVANARYYQPSKGLMQSGFSSTQKFLLRWTIHLESPKSENGLLSSNSQPANMDRFSSNARVEPNADACTKKAGSLNLPTQSGFQIEKKSSAGHMQSDDKVNNFAKGVSNFNMRKAFSEVVAGSTAANSGFPPLQSNKHIMSRSEESIKQNTARDGGREKVNEKIEGQLAEKGADIPAVREVKNDSIVVYNDVTKGNQNFHIGRDVDSMKISIGEKTRAATSFKHVTVYIGFEHECPQGHRFILTEDHLNGLGSPYALPEESLASSSLESADHKGGGPSRGGKNGGHGKGRRQANGIISASSRKGRNLEKSNDRVDTASGKDLERGLQPLSLDDSGSAFSLLDRSLPIFMNCPHCMDLKSKNDQTDVRFAGTISQLQRIFMVTPPFPVILACNPVIQFEASCFPPSVPDREKKLQFSLGCRVILPPESFLSLRLPFVYGVQVEDGNIHPLTPFVHQPQLTAWITKGTTLQLVSKGSNHEDLFA